MLEVDEDSRLGREIIAGGSRYGAAERPSEELTADLYEVAVERLAGLGRPRYEISNFVCAQATNPGIISNIGTWSLMTASAPTRIPSMGGCAGKTRNR